MRLTFFCTLVGLVATSTALSSGIEPAVELLPRLTPQNAKRGASVVDGLQSREISGGFISVLPKHQSIPAEGASKRRRRILAKDEIVVPESLREASSKRGLYCKNSGYGLCPNMEYCCPLGKWVVCVVPTADVAARENDAARLTDAAQTHTTASSLTVKKAAAPLARFAPQTATDAPVPDTFLARTTTSAAVKSGYTCYRNSAGTNLCRAPGSNSDDGDDDTTTRTTRTTTTKVTTTDEVFTQTTQTFEEDSTTTNIETQQVTTPNTFGLPTVTPTFTLPAAANTTSSTSRTSSSSDIPLVASGATVIGVAHSVLISAVVFTLAQVFVA
ncbi:hypothetical protein FRB90_004333 [Tulasnella sp. 427]|nr:hypothetical protein FRB90_004333 [Tulasnella sp. 427]